MSCPESEVYACLPRQGDLAGFVRSSIPSLPDIGKGVFPEKTEGEIPILTAEG